MRSIVLDSHAEKVLLSYARSRIREEEFISSVRDFLSLLAVAEAKDLDYVQSKLLPHRLAIHCGPITLPAHETPPHFALTPPRMPSRPALFLPWAAGSHTPQRFCSRITGKSG
ncbi:hypothetical protein K458DRAFT_424166 [Lentithecium fluviatile CBS 122367]|uniref:Uncharacterized protein n=1 Tax=Lentithecium fluviatile CBS 122367 TaxID=1168545 RepID=A0A6G1IFX5_9PLEO|nr:hypothetical protein K458DRAFT_424166 [Lentithecium fluviatile CBS 122367]